MVALLLLIEFPNTTCNPETDPGVTGRGKGLVHALEEGKI
jgi:hypothetical protein